MNFMRKVLIYCLILLLILALSPALTIFLNDSNKINTIVTNIYTTEEKADNKADYSEDVINLALNYIDKDFCDQGIMAALAIAENNFYYNKENSIKTDENSKKQEQNTELKNKADKLYKKTDIKLSYKKEKVYIPVATLSSGSTKGHKDYPYIKPVASPWDCMDENFVYNKDYSAGISIKGIDYLCKEGMNFKEALKWYLPDFEIK